MELVRFEPGSPAWESNMLTTRPRIYYYSQRKKIIVFKLSGVKRGIIRHAYSQIIFEISRSRAFRIYGSWLWGRLFRKFRLQGGVSSSRAATIPACFSRYYYYTTAADLPNQGCVRLLRDVSLGREASIMSVISGLIAIAVNKKYRELLHYVDT